MFFTHKIVFLKLYTYFSAEKLFHSATRLREIIFETISSLLELKSINYSLITIH